MGIKTFNRGKRNIRDGENLETIFRNIETSKRHVELTNKSLENIVVSENNRGFRVL